MTKRKSITRKKARDGVSLKMSCHPCWLMGYAVMFRRPDEIGPDIEYWKYSPALLTIKQKKQLGIVGWKRVEVMVKDGDNG